MDERVLLSLVQPRCDASDMMKTMSAGALFGPLCQLGCCASTCTRYVSLGAELRPACQRQAESASRGDPSGFEGRDGGRQRCFTYLPASSAASRQQAGPILEVAMVTPLGLAWKGVRAQGVVSSFFASPPRCTALTGIRSSEAVASLQTITPRSPRCLHPEVSPGFACVGWTRRCAGQCSKQPCFGERPPSQRHSTTSHHPSPELLPLQHSQY
ncbi:hypothetical protein K402DRAFT_101280 [Aulographum hederae CBS 113979]|uniref:Uncharacterized protein n=1 Tax=Aulographum hederae CBS 113979 TaxID=1176131 RepID=A0A6G1GY08_9PEZI|nr:hypothetical protein K402DRAFT_101280 [Aulographum hederae CBS 113979]